MNFMLKFWKRKTESIAKYNMDKIIIEVNY